MTARPRSQRVRIRRRRGGIALEIGGTFASYYRPGKASTGSVWDALVAPLAWLPPARRNSVLILGLGGGSAARLARAIAPDAAIVGVESSAAVLKAARRHFDLDALGVEVVCDDAQAYLARTRRRFDLIIEDVFIGTEATVRKPSWLPEPGLPRAIRHLRPGGLIVINTIDETIETARTLGSLMPRMLCIGVEGYDNRVLVGGPRVLDARALRAAVASQPVLAASLPRFQVRRLGP
jgi:SAM-dependent methyltransferase